MSTPRVKIDPAIIGAIRDRFSIDNPQIAELIGISKPDTIDAWEDCSRQPTLRQAEKLVEKLGLSILDLFSADLPPDSLKDIVDYRSAQDEENVKWRVALEGLLYSVPPLANSVRPKRRQGFWHFCSSVSSLCRSAPRPAPASVRL